MEIAKQECVLARRFIVAGSNLVNWPSSKNDRAAIAFYAAGPRRLKAMILKNLCSVQFGCS